MLIESESHTTSRPTSGNVSNILDGSDISSETEAQEPAPRVTDIPLDASRTATLISPRQSIKESSEWKALPLSSLPFQTLTDGYQSRVYLM